MITIHALWTDSRLHLWADARDGDPPVAATEAPPVFPHAELRRVFGEAWDGLLVASAIDSQVDVWLPAAHAQHAPPPTPQAAASGTTVVVDSPALAELKVWTLAFAAVDAVDLLDRVEQPWPSGIRAGGSLRFWAKLTAIIFEHLARGQFVPTVHHADPGPYRGRWQMILPDEGSRDRINRLVAAMPPICRATSPDLAAAAAQIAEDFLVETTDAIVRRCLAGDDLTHSIHDRYQDRPSPLIRWLHSLVAADSALLGPPDDIDPLFARVQEWVSRVAGANVDRKWRTCLRLTPPETDATWRLELCLQSQREPGLVLNAADLPRPGNGPAIVAGAPATGLLDQARGDMAGAARYFPPLAALADPDGPTLCELSAQDAYAFLRDVAAMLEAEDLGVFLPDWWRQGRPRLQMHLAIRPLESAGSPTAGSLNLDSLVTYDWRVALGGEDLTVEEIANLASQGDPLVRVRGRWTEVHPTDLQRALAFLQEQAKESQTTLLGALSKVYAADDDEAGMAITGYTAEGWVATLLNAADAPVVVGELAAPSGFVGTLRPYQLKGLQWLTFLSKLRFGACLADDMGLGKTIQFIALLLHERESGDSPGPTLLVVPMSLVGNWHREIERFGPQLRVMVHHGLERRSGQEFIDEAPAHDVVISTYGLIHRDFEYLSTITWGRLALDEAQNIKNPAAKQSMAVRSLRARHRAALTGTPVENRLSELWTIMDFLNPGYLGAAADFRRRFAVPIERHQDSARTGRLRQLIRPCVLRRVKTDPSIQTDLPAKLEMKVYCNLTREQAGLYQAVVNDMLSQIDRSEGIQRRGLILAALVKLKQICNHPAQLAISRERAAQGQGTSTDSSGPPVPDIFRIDRAVLTQRSGKCERLTEMLEEILAEGDRALVFTQFREMGKLLKQLLEERFQQPVLFLHGGSTRKERDDMVERFQSGKDSPLFVLSLKAGGFGLNLTAANHVFHFDRWWNPAVEDQAADRAHRIGQLRQVQVHKFVCIGTLEERIDAMLEQKRVLAQSVIGTGESWITELSTDALRDLFALSGDAVGDE